MKISSLHIKGFQQFNDTYLDFTNPNTGKPVDKICFIGRNGTGKSTLLSFIAGLLPNLNTLENTRILPFLATKLYLDKQDFYIFSSRHIGRNVFLKPEVETVDDWFYQLTQEANPGSIQTQLDKLKSFEITGSDLDNIRQKLQFNNNSSDLLIYSPAESHTNTYMQVGDVPKTRLDEALGFFNGFPFHHTVADDNVKEFWKILIYLIKKRDNDREAFETREENLLKTKKELIEEFDKDHPKILNRLAELWNRILGKAGLEFDVENASNPIQLNDNLKAYIHLKSTRQKISYSQLSTGIRNFIFRVGHIYSLYFDREIQRGFLLLDEPENSLFPDFLFDLVDTYQELLLDKNGENNTQFFVSTHNPIIAAQFEPYERITLEWDLEGQVVARKGKAPAGDDPNDILTKDFGLKNLMGKQGQEMWQRYLELRKELRKTDDKQKKKDLLHEINKIGKDYNFED